MTNTLATLANYSLSYDRLREEYTSVSGSKASAKALGLLSSVSMS